MDLAVKVMLEKAKNLIRNPDNWTTEKYARDANGVSVNPKSPEACKFCVLGAIMNIQGVNCDDLDYVSRILYKATGYLNISSFNDSHTHKQVLELLDKAIKINGD